MAYSTLAQVQEAAGGSENLRQLTAWEGETTINTDRVDAAIVAADAMIDSYVGRRLRTLLGDVVNPGEVPQSIQEMSADIAVLKLKMRRNQPSPETIDMMELKMSQLSQMARGGLVAGTTDAPAEESQRVIARKIPSSGNFTRDKLKGWL